MRQGEIPCPYLTEGGCIMARMAAYYIKRDQHGWGVFGVASTAAVYRAGKRKCKNKARGLNIDATRRRRKHHEGVREGHLAKALNVDSKHMLSPPKVEVRSLAAFGFSEEDTKELRGILSSE